MTRHEKLRAYAGEPIGAALATSMLANVLSAETNANFMHSAARDLLSILVVLLGASLALWIGLFWIANTEFGKWLAERNELTALNDAFIFTCVILLSSSILCVLCAFLSAQHKWTQLLGEWSALYSLLAVLTMLRNTRGLLGLHSLYVMLCNRTITPISEPQPKSRTK